MLLERMVLGVYGANCYIVGSENTGDCMVIDPSGDAEEIINKCKEMNLKIKYIVLTHGHGDHIEGLLDIKKRTKAPVLIHEEDEYLLLDSEKNLSKLMSIDNVEIKPDKLLNDGDVLSIGELDALVLHTPGHTPGGISIKVKDSIFTGDTLFNGSIGRTDFKGGSYEKLIKSIKNKILVYDDKTKIYPGHGLSTTIEKEKNNNPFIK